MTLRRSSLSFLAAASLAAVLAGCAGAPETRAPQDSTKFTVENTDRFLALDAATEAVISCTGLQERLLADGRLEVVANLRNSGTSAAKVRVQCVFLDNEGQPLNVDPPSQSVALAAGATEVVRFTAPSAAAKRYSIRVRAAH
jgi:hypothetical protein